MTPDIVTAVLKTLRAEPSLAAIQEWQAVNGLITLKAPGLSVGLEKEVFTPDTREADAAAATLRIAVWAREKDPAAGEALVRDLAHAVRYCLNEHRTLGGLVDGGYVTQIEYLTADAGQGLLLHLAEISYEVEYPAERVRKKTYPAVESVSADIGG
jgi:hypothetical protein